MRGLAEGVTPLVDLMWKLALQPSVLGMDETPVMELGGPGRTLNGYSEGKRNRLSSVDVTKPPTMTTTREYATSWPGFRRMMTSGSSAKPVEIRPALMCVTLTPTRASNCHNSHAKDTAEQSPTIAQFGLRAESCLLKSRSISQIPGHSPRRKAR